MWWDAWARGAGGKKSKRKKKEEILPYILRVGD